MHAQYYYVDFCYNIIIIIEICKYAIWANQLIITFKEFVHNWKNIVSWQVYLDFNHMFTWNVFPWMWTQIRISSLANYFSDCSICLRYYKWNLLGPKCPETDNYPWCKKSATASNISMDTIQYGMSSVTSPSFSYLWYFCRPRRFHWIYEWMHNHW